MTLPYFFVPSWWILLRASAPPRLSISPGYLTAEDAEGFAEGAEKESVSYSSLHCHSESRLTLLKPGRDEESRTRHDGVRFFVQKMDSE